MPEIKVKHVVSFSSEDSVYKAENLLKPETYRKWKCASAGEKNASVILQFEKACQIHSIDVGNENSAFVEILVGRSSDSSNNFEVLLVSSSFMSPMESRNGTNSNRVRMFTADKLVQNVKNDKWDRVQIVCTQPFNKTIQYGLSFIKFNSPPDPNDEASTGKKTEVKLGAFKLKEDDDEDQLPIGRFFSKRNEKPVLSDTGPAAIRQASSFAAAILEKTPPETSTHALKLKVKSENDRVVTPKQTVSHVNRQKVGYTNVSKEDSEEEKPNVKDLNKRKVVASPTSSKLVPVAKTQTKARKPKKDFQRIMEKVVFVISGFQNPLRGMIRDLGLEMGAQYKGDWDSSCTHLICAFVNTPKYVTVRGKGGRVVKKDWILDSHKKKELLPWRKYMLGDYSKSTTEEEESDEEPTASTSPKQNKRLNGVLNSPSRKLDLPSTSKVEDNNINKNGNFSDDNEDTDPESDYKADTDLDSDSGGDTEDEIKKVEEENKRIAECSPQKNSPKQKIGKSPTKFVSPKKGKQEVFTDDNSLMVSPERSPLKRKRDESPTNSPSPKKAKPLEKEPFTDDLPLPILPNYFKSKKFFLYGDFKENERHNIQRYITAYNGNVLDYMNEDVKYVVTSSKWNQDFEDAVNENEDIIFVRPQWIYQCHEKEKCMPYQPYIVIPDT